MVAVTSCANQQVTGATLRGGDRRRGLGRGMNRKVIKWTMINFLLTGVLKHTKKGFPNYFRIFCSWWGFLEYLGVLISELQRNINRKHMGY